GNLISVGDVDAGGGQIQVTLTATNGTLTLAGLTGLTFTTGDGTSDATMTFTGTLVDINAALDGMAFTPTLHYNGAASVQITTDDQGNSGIGGALSGSDTVNIAVRPVDHAPVNTVPGPQNTTDDTNLVSSSAHGNANLVIDP